MCIDKMFVLSNDENYDSLESDLYVISAGVSDIILL